MGRGTAFIMLQVAESTSEAQAERPWQGRAATSVGKAGPDLEMESIRVFMIFYLHKKTHS